MFYHKVVDDDVAQTETEMVDLAMALSQGRDERDVVTLSNSPAVMTYDCSFY